MLRHQLNCCIMNNIPRNGGAALAYGRTQGLVHLTVRVHALGFTYLLPYTTGGLPRVMSFDLLHCLETGLFAKFHALLFPFVLLFYSASTREEVAQDPTKAMVSPEDVMHEIETRLKGVAPMRDHRTDLFRLMYEWWTQKYWTGTEWVAFMQRALFVFGRDDRLINNAEMLQLLMHTIRALHRIYYLTKVHPKIYSAAYLEEVTLMVRTAGAGLLKMQRILEFGGRKDVSKNEWRGGANTIKFHCAGGMDNALVDKGSLEGMSTGLYEATNSPMKQCAVKSDGRKETAIDPSSVLRSLYTNDVRLANAKKSLIVETERTELRLAVVDAGTSMGLSAVLLAAAQFTDIPYDNAAALSAKIVMLGLHASTVSTCMTMQDRLGDDGKIVRKRNKVIYGEVVLRRVQMPGLEDDLNCALTLVRFLGAIGPNRMHGTSRCLVQRLLPRNGGQRADRHPVTQLAEYTMENDMFVIESLQVVRLEHVSLQDEGSYQHSRAEWHIGAGRHLKPDTHPEVRGSISLSVIDAVVLQHYPSKKYK